MTEQEIEKFINNTQWIFAKTYANTTPHEYCLFDKSQDKEEYNRFVAHMKSNLVKEKFFSTFFSYFYFGEYKYWTMEKVGEQPILINRANKDITYG
jgi:hypothetical protein